MKITSPAFDDGGVIPTKYTCQGEDINPPLSISGIPSGTQSLVLIVDDPDAPNGDWVHWIVWNIAPNTTEISENSIPDNGIVGTNDGNEHAYMGPCPPSGTHHYQFTVYALSDNLELPVSSRKPEILDALEGILIDQSRLTGLYSK